VELGVVKQRYRAVLEVLEEGTPVTEVARRYGWPVQAVHEWLGRYAKGGGLARIRWELERAGVVPLPGRSGVWSKM
jgi:transposase-like protein